MTGAEEFYAALGGLNQSLNNAAQIQYAQNQTHKDRLFTIEMLERQTEKARENWQMQNEYQLKLPRLMREAYESAGLNPLILYGEGGAVMSAAGSIGQSHAAHHAPLMPHLEAPGTQLGLQLAQIQALRSQAELQETASLKNIAEAKKTSAETSGITIENAFNRDSYQLRLDAIENENLLKQALKDTEFEKKAQLSAEVSRLNTEVDYIINKMNNENRLTDAEVRKINTDIDNSIKRTAHEIALMDAEARKAVADAYLALVTAQIRKDTEGSAEWQAARLEAIKAECARALAQGDAIEIENALKQWHLDMLPHKGASVGDNIGYYWSKFVHYTIGPIGNILSSALAGVGGAMAK